MEIVSGFRVFFSFIWKGYTKIKFKEAVTWRKPVLLPEAVTWRKPVLLPEAVVWRKPVLLPEAEPNAKLSVQNAEKVSKLKRNYYGIISCSSKSKNS